MPAYPDSPTSDLPTEASPEATRSPTPQMFVPLRLTDYDVGRQGSTNEYSDIVLFDHVDGTLGIPLGTVLRQDWDTVANRLLVNCDCPGLPENIAAKISLKIEFEGARGPYTRQIMSRRSTAGAETVSFKTLAKKVAQELQTAMSEQNPCYNGKPIDIKDIVLCKLRRVGRGTWVPDLKLFTMEY